MHNTLNNSSKWRCSQIKELGASKIIIPLPPSVKPLPVLRSCGLLPGMIRLASPSFQFQFTFSFIHLVLTEAFNTVFVRKARAILTVNSHMESSGETTGKAVFCNLIVSVDGHILTTDSNFEKFTSTLLKYWDQKIKLSIMIYSA